MIHRQSIAWLVWLLLMFASSASALVPAPADLRDEAARYKSGEGVIVNYARTYDLYCLAALQGDSEAAYHLGSMHLNGLGRAADDGLAAGWFEHAEKQGDTGARLMLQERLDGIAPAADPDCPMAEPVPDRDVVTKWVRLLAPYYDLKPELVLSLIQVESNFNARAKSPKNAQGLMQLMPATARRFGVEDIGDPLQNLQGGMAYLQWLSDHFPGRIKLVLAAYNAGEHAVKKYKGIPPYKETRLYVKKVVRNYVKYIRARKGISKSYKKYASNNRSNSRYDNTALRQARSRNDRALSTKYIPPSSIR